MSEAPNIPSIASDVLRPELTVPPRGAAAARPAGPAFEVLLERLSARAAELDAKSKTLASAEELPGALDVARASLEDALHLGEELLEAYRAAQRAPEAGR